MKAWTSTSKPSVAAIIRVRSTQSFLLVAISLAAVVIGAPSRARSDELPLTTHPRLYFTAAELTALRADHDKPPRNRIWKNLLKSAEWCRRQQPRTEWIPTKPDDPQFENLYDRFYAA